MGITEKIKTINNRIEQSKALYDLDKEPTKISALSSGNVSKYEFLTSKDALPEKDLREEATTTKISEYSPLGKELKAPTDIGIDQYKFLKDKKKLLLIT